MKTPRRYDNKKLSMALRSGRVSEAQVIAAFNTLHGESVMVGKLVADALTHLEIISVKTMRDLHGVIATDRYYQQLSKITRETAQALKVSIN
ncbi:MULTISPECIES: hypothetical protein [Enterobacter cloacae complex]|uniref:hypothetical protein n=1 Tax=Enterobacter cloacae complex TaxID=354276 RepID=UPI00345A99E6